MAKSDDQTEPGEIVLGRQLGHGLIVQTAPRRARMALALLAEHGYGLSMASNDQINIADQVLYQVVGYDPESAALVLELVEDWRPVPHKRMTEAEYEAIAEEWKRRHGGGRAHEVRLLLNEA